MGNVVYPPATREIGDRRRELAPAIHEAFDAFSRQVFADGGLPAKTKQLIAVAAVHVTHAVDDIYQGAVPELLPFFIAGRGSPASRITFDLGDLAVLDENQLPAPNGAVRADRPHHLVGGLRPGDEPRRCAGTGPPRRGRGRLRP